MDNLIKTDKALKQLDELRESIQLFQNISKELFDYKYALDASTIIAITDQKGIINKVNSNFCKISKYSEEELIGQDHRILSSGYHTKQFIRDLWVTIANGKIWKGEFRNKAKDGTFYWVDSTIIPFFKKGGKPYQYLSIRSDITARKEAEDKLIQLTAQLIAVGKTASLYEELKKGQVALTLNNKELKKTNERFDLIGKAANEGLWDLNLETGQLWANEIHQQIYGLSLADPVPNYEVWKHRIHPEDRDRTVKTIEDSLTSGCDFCTIEYRFNTKRTGYINIHGRFLIERNTEGNPVRQIGSMIDISDRIKKEEALVRSEKQLQVVLDTSPTCIKLVNKSGLLEAMNLSGLVMIEADSFEQIKGKSLLDIINKPYRRAFGQLTKNVFKGESGKLEFEITGLKGSCSWLETYAVPLKDAEGKIISLLGTTIDITERKKRENEILQAIQRYELLAKATSDTIWDWDIKNDIILYNEGIFHMLGYEKLNIANISKWWETKIHPDDLQIVLKAISSAFIKQSSNLQLEYRFRCADESYKYIYDRAFIIYDDHNKPYKLIGAMQDTTKLRENEISLMELNRNLQKQSKELATLNEELVAKNGVLKKIAWTQSHIVRAPLAKILGIINVIKNIKVGSPEYEEWINHIITSGNELDTVIKDIVNKTIIKNPDTL